VRFEIGYSLSSGTPVGFFCPLVGGRDPRVGRARPEPPVDVDWLEVLGVAALALEVALAPRRVDRAHVVCKRN
jgi:hypothetical protein